MKLVLGFTVSFFILLINPQLILAHVLKTNGSIGGVLHVSPDDDPFAKIPTDFFIEFKDKQNKFQAVNCNCKVEILKSGQPIYSGPLFQYGNEADLTSASFSFTFPEKNIYKIKITGDPIYPDAFQAFVMEYDLRVSREPEQTNISLPETNSQNSIMSWIKNHIPHILAGITISSFLVFALLSRPKLNSNKK